MAQRTRRCLAAPAAGLVALVSTLACGDEYVARELEPYWPTAEWRFTDPRDAGMDHEALENLVHALTHDNRGVDSLTVVRRGYVVTDAYFNNHTSSQLHQLYSCTKSVVSTLIGIGIDRGVVPPLDTQLTALFDEHTINNLDYRKRAITLEHLLTMRGGLDARDSYLYEWEGLAAMRDADDAVQYVLNLPMAESPGTRFEYTNGISHLLSALLQERTGDTALAYAQTHLFAPLGIVDADWSTDSAGRNWGYAHLHLTSHDMAKLGYLFLNEGTWDTTQVVPTSWVAAATQRHTAATMVDGYGYQWWVDDSGYYLALGYMGQFIFVSPAHDLVAVFTASQDSAFNYALPMFESRIVPAVIGD